MIAVIVAFVVFVVFMVLVLTGGLNEILAGCLHMTVSWWDVSHTLYASRASNVYIVQT